MVNLYPFEQTVAKPDVTLHDAIENIDIGGPSMLRSAAKNHDSVTVVVDPLDYAEVAKQISENGNTTLELRRKLAAKVFARTAAYDARDCGASAEGIQAAQNSGLPLLLSISAPLAQPLRYGENPHQKAALYGKFHEFFQQLHGKELSYNNILDLTAAANLIAEFASDPPTLAILKHTNPCGVGQGANLREAWDKAFATDKQAPFGGIIAVNQHAGRRVRGGHRGNFQRGHRRAGFFGGSAGDFAEEEKSAAAQIVEIAADGAVLGRAQRGRGFIFVAATRFENDGGGGFENCHQAAADGSGIERDAVRLARGEAREIERDCLCGGGPDAGHRRGADEPRGCQPHRGLEGGRGEAFAQRQRGLQRRLFSVSRRIDCGGGSGRDGGDPAGRFGARRGSDCGGGRAELAMAFTGTRHFRH